MTAKIIDGESIAEKLKEHLKAEVEGLKGLDKHPHLVAVQIGQNPASQLYVRNQQRTCEEIGIAYTLDELPAECAEDELIRRIHKLNNDPMVTGIILQMPLPQGINAERAQTQIAPDKDVEGMNPSNMGAIVYGKYKIGPCTAMAAIELIKSLNIEIRGMNATVVGRSAIVGKPVALMLLDLSATPTICHTKTRDFASQTKRADLLIAAAGRAEMIRGEMIKPGAIVIDVGINRIKVLDSDGNPVLNDNGKPKMKTVGDVAFSEAKEVASYLTPVPGGVGPMTVAMLLKNTVEAAKMGLIVNCQLTTDNCQL